MKFRPLHDRVVVKRIDAEEKTSGGIIIPDTAKEKPSQGQRLLRRSAGQCLRRGRLVRHRRRRNDRSRRVHGDHRPIEGRDQIRR